MMMKTFFNYFYNTSNSFSADLLRSIAMLFIFATVYYLLNKILNKKVSDFSKRRTIKVKLRNFLFLLLVFILFSLWAGQIKTVLLSTAALSAAVIITFKEVILSFFASFFISSNQLFTIGDEIEYENIRFTIGDEIEYENIRGKVLDKNFFGIKVQSFNATENKIVFIPNIVFLTNKVINFSRVNYIKFNHFNINIELTNTLIDFIPMLEMEMDKIMEFNNDTYTDFKSTQMDYFDKIIPDKNYYFKFDLSEVAKNQIQIYYFAKRQDKDKIENLIATFYFKFLKEQSCILKNTK